MTQPRPMYLGIDLGTTNSAAAVFDGDNVSLVRNAQGSTLTPSVVRYDARGTASVGARARKFLETDPQNTRAEFKRLMGTSQPIAFAAAKLSRRPEELAAEVLRALRADVNEQHGFLPERAVISVPALFELPQSAATSEAARLAGFAKVELIQEPVASAIAAGWRADDDAGNWLVYDLGGGTFDASLLETRDGFLRVIGHDGDNFLGGRDFDWAVVDWALAEISRAQGKTLARGDAAQAGLVRQLKLAAEEAKIELSRAAETAIVVTEHDVDLVLTRDVLDGLIAPLVDRTVEICRRLAAAHKTKLERIVLVGGPTVMPALRQRVADALEAPFAGGIDPMTIVARGAAIYAITAGLDARPAGAPAPAKRRAWLQYPAMSPALTPHVIGKIVFQGASPLVGGTPTSLPDSGAPPTHIQLVRGDDLWKSEPTALDEDGGFVIGVELVARKANLFQLLATGKDGKPVPIDPATLTIVQGLTISDPLLSRSIGVATADDSVRVYFERGAPLPARRTFTHYTIETVAKGLSECVLKIPIVQGELTQAHLCRLVGTLEIPGSSVGASLPAGSAVEITIELDRGGRLSARALVPALTQVFEQVAHLLVPEASPEALLAGLASMRARAETIRGDAFRRGAARTIERLNEIDRELAEIAGDAAAAAGGDSDAGQKARRTLLELDALLEQCDADRHWPELEDEARTGMASASRWVAEYGTPVEQQLLADVAQSLEKARAGKQAMELQRQLRLVRQLAAAARARHPEYWQWVFNDAAAESSNATDLPRAQKLVADGKRAIEQRNNETLRNVVQELWRLLPADAQDRRLGFDSGVR